MSLRELYQEMIVDHGKRPRNFKKLADANYSHAGHNPLCGDKLVVYLKENNGKVEDIAFEGTGCAISVASASLMTEILKGKSLSDAETLFQDFHQLVTGETVDKDLGKLSIFAGVAEFPVRVKCATLAWHTLKAALSHDDKIARTE